jgi:hypothetical protein
MKKIPLSQGLFALVDDEDFERVNAFKWCASLESRGTKYYAIRWVTVNRKRVKIRMAHFILDIPPGSLAPGTVVDHRHHDSLDNRKENLEIISQEENMRRSQGWKKKVEEPCL